MATRTTSLRQSLETYLRGGLATLDYLLWRFLLLWLLAVAAAMTLTVAALQNVTVSDGLFAAGISIALGLLLGFAARFLFRTRTPVLRFLAAVTALIGALFLVGWFTWGFFGPSPLSLPRPAPDWLALAQMGGGAAAVFLALAARRPQPRPQPAPGDIAVGVGEGPLPAPPAVATARPAAVSYPKVNVSPARKPNMFERVRTRLRGRTDIRFSGAEEHRCPYCLQPVLARDPRGVVTCPICHTRHHKDCWDITGMCQIPHYHA